MYRLLLILFFLLSTTLAYAQVAGSACTGSATAGPDTNGKNLKCNGTTWQVVPVSGATPTQTNVTASRALGTVYQNTNSTMLFVEVITGSNSNLNDLTCFSDNTTSPSNEVSYHTGTYGHQGHFMVLPGNYYDCQALQGNQTLQSWTEVRLPF